MTHRAAKFRQEYQEIPEPMFGMAASDAKPSDFDQQTYDTYEYVGTIDESKAIIQRIREAVDETFQETGGDYPTVVIVGIEDYVASDAWVRYDTGNSEALDDVVPGEILTVPGRMIHVPKRNGEALMDHLSQEHTDD